jgi:hypothetical protein
VVFVIVGAVVALAIGALVFVLRKGKGELMTNGPQAATRPGCGAAEVQAGVEQAMAGAQSGAQAGPYGAAAGAGLSALGTIAGPCGPKIEKKLRELLKSLDPRIAQRAKAALAKLDKAKEAALRAPGDAAASAAKKAGDAVKGAGKSAKKTGNKAKKLVGL